MNDLNNSLLPNKVPKLDYLVINCNLLHCHLYQQYSIIIIHSTLFIQKPTVNRKLNLRELKWLGTAYCPLTVDSTLAELGTTVIQL